MLHSMVQTRGGNEDNLLLDPSTLEMFVDELPQRSEGTRSRTVCRLLVTSPLVSMILHGYVNETLSVTLYPRHF
jgi:hypothetical protein